MKLLLAVFSLFLSPPADEPVLVPDKELKKPIGHTMDFTTQLYLQRSFPVYASDVNAVLQATNKAVKWIDKEQPCRSSTRIGAAHSRIIIEQD